MKESEYLKLIRKVYENIIDEYHTSIDKSKFEPLFLDIAQNLIETKEEDYKISFDLIIENYLKSVKAISKLSPGLATGLFDIKGNILLNTYNGKVSDIPNDKEITEKTVFDSSSITKMFTAILLLKEAEKGNIDLYKTFAEYNPILSEIDVSIIDALRFGVNFRTDGRLDEPNISNEERIRRLKNTYIYERDTFIYSDIPYMLVPLLFGKTPEEGTENYLEKFYSLFRDELHLSNTGYSTINMTGGTIEVNLNNKPMYRHGGIFDSKANIFESQLGIISGHAGVTTTVEDLEKLFAHLKGGLLSDDSINILTKTVDSQPKEEGKKVNHGMGIYINTGSIRVSDVPAECSDNAFVAAGSTGTYSIFDIENGFNAIYLSNVRSGIYSKWINTEDYIYGDKDDEMPKYHQTTLISGTGTIQDGRMFRPDGSFMSYVRATNNFKEESIKTLLKLRIAKLSLIEKAKLEYTDSELDLHLSAIEETFNNKTLKTKTKRLEK